MDIINPAKVKKVKVNLVMENKLIIKMYQGKVVKAHGKLKKSQNDDKESTNSPQEKNKSSNQKVINPKKERDHILIKKKQKMK